MMPQRLGVSIFSCPSADWLPLSDSSTRSRFFSKSTSLTAATENHAYDSTSSAKNLRTIQPLFFANEGNICLSLSIPCSCLASKKDSKQIEQVSVISKTSTSSEREKDKVILVDEALKRSRLDGGAAPLTQLLDSDQTVDDKHSFPVGTSAIKHGPVCHFKVRLFESIHNTSIHNNLCITLARTL